MKFKLKDITEAVNYIKYTGGMEDSHIEISVREEDFETNKISSCMTLSASTLKEHKSYDRVKTPKTVTISIEVFPESENRPPRVVTQESQDLSMEN